MFLNLLGILTVAVPPGSAELVEYYWRDFLGEIPRDAVEGAAGLYIGQVVFNGLLPATIYPQQHVAVSSAEGHKIEMKEGVKILCVQKEHAGNLKWEYTNVKNLKKSMKLVRGGFEKGYVLYIGKIFHEGDWKIGKIFPPGSGLQGLRIWHNAGPEFVSQDFQVLHYEEGDTVNKTERENTVSDGG